MAFALPPAEYNALQDLYDTCDGDSWRWTNPRNAWIFPANASVVSSSAPCSNIQPWEGIECSTTCALSPCNVISLNLTAKGVTCALPSSIGSLTKLQQLSFYLNRLTGRIPMTMKSLTSLTKLDLDGNFLTGSFPNNGLPISALTNLQILYLQANLFTGSIPAAFGSNLQDLHIFAVENNAFTSSLPHTFSNCTELFRLDLPNNFFTGGFTPITSSSWYTILTSLLNLEQLFLFGNLLTGNMPTSLIESMSSNISVIEMDRNHFTGCFPLNAITTKWGHSMTILDIHDNYFSGFISDEITNNTRLEVLLLNDNAFTSTLPAHFFESLPRLNIMNAANNAFTGSLPERYILDAPGVLKALYLQNNLFSGSIPPQLLNVTTLQLLQLGGNLFSGTIPDLYNSGDNRMVSLSLNDNMLSGSLPMTLSEAGLLTILTLHHNQLTGRIPSLPTLSTLLVELSIQENYFNGWFPSSTITKKPLIKVINAAENMFSGPLPKYGGLNLTIAYFYSNFFSSTIPASFFTSSPYLQAFIASKNCLSGTLPISFSTGQSVFCESNSNLVQLLLDGAYDAAQCPDYEGVRRYSVGLSGTIPGCLFTDLPRLNALHLAGNQFSGSISLASGKPLTQSLTNVVLAGNNLRGKLPSQFWDIRGTKNNSEYLNLDLSFNRLQFVVPEDWSVNTNFSTSITNRSVESSSGPSLQLKVNRVSGSIPEGVRELLSVDVLDGNMFACSYDDTQREHELPRNDPHYRGYECGSNSTDEAIYAWLAGLLTLLFVVLLGRWLNKRKVANGASSNVNIAMKEDSECGEDRQRHGQSGESEALHDENMVSEPSVVETIHSYKAYVMRTSVSNTPSASPSPSIIISSAVQDAHQALAPVYQHWRHVVWLVIIALILCLPVYVALSSRYASHTYNYFWTLSGAYMDGITPGIVMYILLVTIAACLMYHTVVVSDTHIHTSVPRDTTGVSIDANADTSNSNIDTSSINPNLQSTNTCRPRAILALALLIDVLVVLVFNSVYVYVLSQQSGTDPILMTFFSLSLSLFKWLWTTQVVLGPRIRMYIEDSFGVIVTESVLIVITVINNLLLPFMSEMLLSPSCFYYLTALSKPQGIPAIVSTFITYGCENFTVCPLYCVGSECYYSCGTYVICPVNLLEINRRIHHSDSYMNYDMIERGSSLEDDIYQGLIARNYAMETSMSVRPSFHYSYQCTSSLLSIFTSIFVYWYIFSGVVMPLIMALARLLATSPLGKKVSSWTSSTTFDRFLPLLQKSDTSFTAMMIFTHRSQRLRFLRMIRQSFVVKFVTDLAVILSFGLLVPPLALIIAVSMFQDVLAFERGLIRLMRVAEGGAMYKTVRQNGRVISLRLEEKVADREMRLSLLTDVTEVMTKGLDKGIGQWVIRGILLASTFWSFLLFDTFGGESGARDAIWIAVTPVVILLVAWMGTKYWIAWRAIQESTRSLNAKENIEQETELTEYVNRSSSKNSFEVNNELSPINPIHDSQI